MPVAVDALGLPESNENHRERFRRSAPRLAFSRALEPKGRVPATPDRAEMRNDRRPHDAVVRGVPEVAPGWPFYLIPEFDSLRVLHPVPRGIYLITRGRGGLVASNS